MKENPSFVALDWLDAVLLLVTLAAGFGVVAVLGWSADGALFKGALALALIGVFGARRAWLGPPRVSTVRRGATALGLVGMGAMLFGAVILTFGATFFVHELQKPVAEPAVIDRDKLGLPDLRLPCTRDGKVVRGRDCMTPVELAADDARRVRHASDDAALRDQLRDANRAARAAQLRTDATIAGAGILLFLIGIGLDVWRTRRAAP